MTKQSLKMLFGFAASILISIPALLSPMIYADMDAYARANWGLRIFAERSWLHIIAGAWLPFHAILLSLSHYLTTDAILAPRLLTLLLNAASVPLVYMYTNNLIGFYLPRQHGDRIGVIAMIFYCLSPFRLAIATVPLSESVAMFFCC